MRIGRYDEDVIMISSLDIFADVLTQVEFLTARDYVADLLVRSHGVTGKDAKKRATSIVPYVRTAAAYIAQAQSGPPEVSFLPCYYAVLNLLKVYVLLSPRHAELPDNRWHGATYSVFDKDSQGLETEAIKIKTKGAIPLVYEIITGHKIAKDVTVQMRDVYPYIPNVTVEWNMATSDESRMFGVHFSVSTTAAGKHVGVNVELPTGIGAVTTVPSLRSFKLLRGFVTSGTPSVTFSTKTPQDASLSDRDVVLSCVRRCLIYARTQYPPPGFAGFGVIHSTPASNRHLLLPEELPIALALFHLSNVARYKPDFLAQLRDSRYWPVIATTQKHALFQFLVLFWSYAHQKTLIMRPA